MFLPMGVGTSLALGPMIASSRQISKQHLHQHLHLHLFVPAGTLFQARPPRLAVHSSSQRATAVTLPTHGQRPWRCLAPFGNQPGVYRGGGTGDDGRGLDAGECMRRTFPLLCLRSGEFRWIPHSRPLTLSSRQTCKCLYARCTSRSYPPPPLQRPHVS